MKDKIDLKKYFSDYEGGNDFEKACQFIEEKFHDINKFDPKRIHVHFTCATDSKDVDRVFNEVRDVIIKNNLHISNIN
jgi:guanine nucleotide-binding protein G(i) subunit alpha